MRKPRIYIAGPYTQGDTEANVKAAIGWAQKISEMGGNPYIPHLTHYWNAEHEHSYDFWMEYDESWLLTCDAIFRFPGYSPGADKEMQVAEELGLYIYSDLKELKKLFTRWGIGKA